MPKGQTVSKCDIVGIDYEASYVKGMDSNGALLAGALRLPSTQELWGLYFSDQATKPILDDWIKARSANFDTNNQSKTIQIKATVIESAFKQEYQSAICGVNRPTIGAANVIKENIADITLLWFFRRLLQAKPSLFPKSTFNPTVSLDRYDVLHGWKLFAWIWRSHSRKQIPKNPQRTDAIAPMFYLPQGATGATMQTSSGPSDARGRVIRDASRS